jgi:diguanylate cyclase (GGDEF)-like protein/PAS domain S-box-containing protein
LEAVLDATRQLMWITNPAEAADVASKLITLLGGQSVPADGAYPVDAMPVDVSFGEEAPFVPSAPPMTLARLMLERHLPSFMIDAQRALALADTVNRLTTGGHEDIDRFFSLSLDLLCICGSDGDLRQVNPAWTAALGYGVDELLGEPFASFVHPDDLAEASAEIAKLRGGPASVALETVAFETRYRCRDGSYRSLLWRIARPPDQGLMYAVARDITDHKRSEAKFENLLEAAPDAMLGVDPSGLIQFVNRQTELLFGYERADLVGRPIATLVPQSSRKVHPAHRAGYVKSPRARAMGAGLELTGLRRDGSEFPVDISLASIETEDGLMVTAAVRDVTDQKQATQNARSLATAQDLVQTVMASSSVGIALVSRAGSFQVVNRTLCDLLGYDEAWFLTHRVDDILHPDDVQDVLQARFQDPAGGSLPTVTLRLMRADGATLWVRRVTVDLPVGESEAGVLMLQLENVTAEHEAHEALAYQAFHDPLTALHNRAWILDMLHTDLPASRRLGTSVGLLLVDLDNFRVVNDSLGHAAGDEVLTTVADRIVAALRPGDRVARFGGDEFVVVVQDVHHGIEVESCAERVSAAITADIRVQGHRFVPTASIGIAVSTPTSTPDSLIRHADSALSQAKASGRAHWQYFDDAMLGQALARITVEDELRDAIIRREFVVHYQPIVSLADAHTVGHEALVRWMHPTRGLLSPAEFLDVAEDTGLIGAIGGQVLDQACALLAAHPDLPGPVSVNVSAVQLAAPDWLQSVLDTFSRHQVDPARIVIEVTETAVLTQMDATASALTSLHRLGVGIHVDDFGTGYSSISVLRDLPVTGVKLDLRFVHDLTAGDSKANALANGLSALVNGLHLTGIAEGVETRMQADILRSQGWLCGQGYYFAKPGATPAMK